MSGAIEIELLKVVHLVIFSCPLEHALINLGLMFYANQTFCAINVDKIDVVTLTLSGDVLMGKVGIKIGIGQGDVVIMDNSVFIEKDAIDKISSDITVFKKGSDANIKNLSEHIIFLRHE